MKYFSKLWPFVKPQWRLLFSSILLAIPLSAIRFSPAPLLKYLMDSILVKKDMRMLVLLPLAVVGIYLINLVVRYGHTYLGRLANERVLRDIREKLVSHYIDLSSSFFTESSVGKLISRVTNDVFYISQGTINLANMVRETVTFLGFFIYAAHLNMKLLALTLGVAPVLIWVSKRSGILMKGYSAKMQEANGYVYSSLQEAFSGFKVVKAFSLEKFAFQRFKDKNDEYVKFALKAARVEEIVGPIVELMAAISIALILYVGGLDVVHEKLSPGDLLAFFTCFGLMINPIRNLNEINLKLNQAGASAERIEEAMNIRNDILEAPGAKPLLPFHSKVEFQNVSFRYSVELPWIFKNVSLTVPQGKMVAIVGASGQGKSTIVNLLPRLYDPVEGRVLIDGHDITKATIASVRSQMALVTQDVFLFNDTVFANIAAGKPGGGATREEVVAAADAAYATAFIERMPQGFDSIIGDRGQKLSGGERQRISIARAILRNAPILLLDEATSSLDTESEKAVQQALDHLMQGRTTLVIAHRLSTIKHADQILVLSEGKIQEAGTHDELIEKHGEYARFYALLA